MQRDTIERPFVSAKFLLAPVPLKATTVVVPEGFKITKCPARHAAGSHRAVASRAGDTRPPITPTNILTSAYANRGLRGYAATR